MTSAEAMAIAVLKGDLTAARALADHLSGEWAAGGETLPPVTTVPATAGRLKAVLHRSPDLPMIAEADRIRVADDVSDWLNDRGRAVMVMPRGWRVDLYALPDQPEPAGTPVDSARVRVGSFVADIHRTGYGSVTIDGRATPVMGFTLTCRAGEPPRILVEHALAEAAG